MSTMMRREDIYRVGVLGRTHGIHGEINFRFDDDAFLDEDISFFIVETDGLLVPFFFEEYRLRSDTTAIIKFCDVDTQEHAQEYTNCAVYLPRPSDAAATTLSPAQLAGFTVVDSDSGATVGTLLSVDDSTENVLFLVRLDGTDEERLLPAGGDLVQDIDARERRIVMRLPDGILDI